MQTLRSITPETRPPMNMGTIRLLWVLGVLQLTFQTGIAQELTVQDSTQQSPAVLPATVSLSQFKERILTLSQRVRESVESDSFTPERLAAQRDLVNELSRFLAEASPSEFSMENQLSKTESSTKPLPADQSTSPETGQGATAGLAPASPLTREDDLGLLPPRDSLADAVWGHLPALERDDLMRTYSESYLPGYEDQVRNYFEQLAKLQPGTPNSGEHISVPTRAE